MRDEGSSYEYNDAVSLLQARIVVLEQKVAALEKILLWTQPPLPVTVE